jgi:DNA-binding transcriptional ArsR family regulator
MSRRAPSTGVRPAAPASVFAALGDETRLALVSRLCRDGPQSITRLAHGFPMTRQAITKHLRTMEQAGLVRSIARGRESLWQIEPKRIAEAQRQLEIISAQWDQTLDRLKRFVEQPRGGRHSP